ncbi:MAG: copper chaperone PCu(A)C [Caldilineaceae bacterium]|nr:copper chaperone PCu(A)C [Caldilineaceae bacterium]HRJ41896.1 copper chaperone PCu(A)C [Caldilineaceae bacterium]
MKQLIAKPYRLIPLLLMLLLTACAVPPPPMATQSGSGQMMPEKAPAMVEGTLTVGNVRANLSLPSDTGSVWLTISNGTDTDDALIGAEIPGCGVVELHDMVMENSVMVMKQVEGGQIAIPAGETVELKQGGLHVMCINKEAPREVGSTVDLVLHFANGGDIVITGAPVVAPGGMKMP